MFVGLFFSYASVFMLMLEESASLTFDHGAAADFEVNIFVGFLRVQLDTQQCFLAT